MKFKVGDLVQTRDKYNDTYNFGVVISIGHKDPDFGKCSAVKVRWFDTGRATVYPNNFLIKA